MKNQYFSGGLVCLIILLMVSSGTLVADEKDRKKKKPAIDKIKLILHRQKGEKLGVYINSHGVYVNGKSVSTKELYRVAKKSKLLLASITYEPYITKSKIGEIEELLEKSGIKKISKQVMKKKREKSDKKKSSGDRKQNRP